MTSRRGGRPRQHQITAPDDRYGGRAYPWAEQEPATGTPWTCSCGGTGDDQAAAEKHLRDKARSALARVDNDRAWSAAVISTGRRDDVLAVRLVWACRRWVRHPGLRKHLVGYYDHWGSLSVEVNWEAIAVALDAGGFTGQDIDDNDLLVLRIAVSLAGVAITVRLADLRRMQGDNARHVREALLKLIVVDDPA